MANPRVSTGGGWAAIRYVFSKAKTAGGLWPLVTRLRSRNTCKTCALGMGGANGGMVNEAGRFPEVCKKSVQVQAGDMMPAIAEAYFERMSFADLERLSSYELQRLGRLGFPLRREAGDDRYRRCSWEEAMQRTAAALSAAAPDRTFFYASGRSSNEAAFLLQLIARAYGTPHIHNCSYYCHAASGVALSRVYGSGTASIVLEDLDQADFAMVAGANPASNHPRLLTRLLELRRRGGFVVMVNPLKELGLTRFRIPSDVRSMAFGSDLCDLYLQPKVGADIPLFLAMLQGVVERGALDAPFLEMHTTGWADVKAALAEHSRDELLAQAGIGRGELDQAVEAICRAERGILAWAMGLTHHKHGTDNVHALANLALARGWLGRPGAGLLPIRGHSNVQGVGSVGVSPAVKDAFALHLEELYGIDVPRDPGQDTYASMRAAEAGEVQAAVLLGGNLFASNPDRDWAARALQNVPFSVSLTTHLNEGHVHGRSHEAIVLPVLARDEEPQITTQESMFNFVRRSDGGPPAIEGEMRSEVGILADLATSILPAGVFDWSKLHSHDALREGIAKAVPGYEELTSMERREFHIPGRTFHRPEFATPDGRAHFRVTPLPEFGGGAGGSHGNGNPSAPDSPSRYPFRLMTLRSEGQFNTVVYEVEDLYRGNTRRDVVMMAAADAKELGVSEGDRVSVRTEIGAMEVSVAIVDLRAGSLAMYYPEANALVPRAIDPDSKTPAFKSVAAAVEALGVPAARG